MMRDYRVLKALVTLWIVIVPSLAHGQRTGRIIDTVFTPFEFDEAVAPDVTITFTSRKNTAEVRSDESGKYAITLPPGIYQVAANRAGFCAIPRAEFIVEAGTDILINVVIIVCPTHTGSPLQTNSVRPRRPEQAKPFLISFANRSVRSGDVEYHGMKLGEHNVAAVVTYDSLAIYGDTLILKKNSSRFQAEGHVVTEYGKVRRRISQATIDFGALDPIATLRIE